MMSRQYFVYVLGNFKRTVLYEVFPNPTLAIEREKQLKRWNREKKNNLIVTLNPTLIDLYPTII